MQDSTLPQLRMLKYNSSAGKGYLKTIGAVKGSEITTGSVHIWFRRWDEISCTRSDGGQEVMWQ